MTVTVTANTKSCYDDAISNIIKTTNQKVQQKKSRSFGISWSVVCSMNWPICWPIGCFILHKTIAPNKKGKRERERETLKTVCEHNMRLQVFTLWLSFPFLSLSLFPCQALNRSYQTNRLDSVHTSTQDTLFFKRRRKKSIKCLVLEL